MAIGAVSKLARDITGLFLTENIGPWRLRKQPFGAYANGGGIGGNGEEACCQEDAVCEMWKATFSLGENQGSRFCVSLSGVPCVLG